MNIRQRNGTQCVIKKNEEDEQLAAQMWKATQTSNSNVGNANQNGVQLKFNKII